MKSIVFLFAVGLASAQALTVFRGFTRNQTALRISEESDCKCFASFKPTLEKDRPDRGYICSRDKVSRRFYCGFEQPPACQCKENEQTLTMEIGVLDCTSTKHGHHSCQPHDIWNQYFANNPGYQILD